MRYVPITEVARLGESEIVPYTRGTVTYIGKFIAGETPKGKYSFQTVELADPANPSVKFPAKFKDRVEVPSNYKGHILHLISKQSDRGLTGIRIEMDKYKNDPSKDRLVLWVTPSAEVGFNEPAGAQTAPPPPQASPPPMAPPPPQQMPPPPAPPPMAPPPYQAPQPPYQAPQVPMPPPPQRPPADPKALVVEAKKFVASRANGYRICVVATAGIVAWWKERFGEVMPQETTQACIASLFIAADRAGTFDHLPYTDISDMLVPKTAAPAPPPQAPPPPQPQQGLPAPMAPLPPPTAGDPEDPDCPF